MLTDVLKAVPQEAEPLDGWGVLCIAGAFIFYIVLSNIILSVEELSNNQIIHAIYTSIILFVPTWALFRAVPGPLLGILISPVPVILVFICLLFFRRDFSVNILPVGSFVGLIVVVTISWIFDFISEKLHSIPMTWGMFIFIIVGAFSYLSSRD